MSTHSLALYGLAGLKRCWMPDRQSWSHKYHLDGRMHPNESVPHSDIYYSLNVLLGLAKVRPLLGSEHYDVPALLQSLCATAIDLPMRNGAWGMALWAAAEHDVDLPNPAADRIRTAASDPARMLGWTAQDIGLSISGVCAQARRDPSWRRLARMLGDVLLNGFRSPGSLFRDSGRGPRRYFATFATQVYAALALYHLGELFEDDVPIGIANTCVRTLLSLQGPLGEWPWFYWPQQDRMVDPYEVYSVHQHGMAPALLHHAVDHRVPGARQAMIKGFYWIFGANEMRRSMMVPDLQLIYRSQARYGVHGSRNARLGRAAYNALTGRGSWSAQRPRLRLTEEMRSYEFGWLLWSFGDRTDYPELTEHRAFQAGVESLPFQAA